jgi:AraC-like DNA-binding protein
MAVLALEFIGADTDSILAEIEVSKVSLMNPLLRIPIIKEHKFWKLAFEKTSNPHLALEMAKQVPFGAFPLLEYIGASSKSLMQSLLFFNKYAKVVYGDWNPTMTEGKKIIEINLGTVGNPDSYRYTNEFGFGLLINRLKYFGVSKVPLKKVHFRHSLMGSQKEYESFFGAKVLFNQSQDCLFFDREIKNIPCKNSDNYMLGSLLSLAEKILSQLTKKPHEEEGELIFLLRGAIKEQLTLGEPNIHETAKQCGLSSRTLQRRLEHRGTSLSQLVTTIRKELALQFLKNSKLTHEEIALTLGYSTLSAFNRAFKLWFKMTPSQYKKT